MPEGVEIPMVCSRPLCEARSAGVARDRWFEDNSVAWRKTGYRWMHGNDLGKLGIVDIGSISEATEQDTSPADSWPRASLSSSVILPMRPVCNKCTSEWMG